MMSPGRAASSAGAYNPAAETIALLAGVPITSVTRCTCSRARTTSAMRISATESLYRLVLMAAEMGTRVLSTLHCGQRQCRKAGPQCPDNPGDG